MEIVNLKKTKKQQIFEILNANSGFISDDEAAKILGNENLHNVSEYIRMWKALQRDRSYFEGKKIVEKIKGHRCHLARTEEMPENQYIKISKQFYDEIKISQ